MKTKKSLKNQAFNLVRSIGLTFALLGRTGGLLLKGKPAILPSCLVLVIKPTSVGSNPNHYRGNKIKSLPQGQAFILWSGVLDSNQRHLAPKASALPG